ncbi:MAG TPA: DUF1616 domain-containing protein [Candidatus Thermoplasmatota archaeon]|nr:DUF1616 domain-containing protein [Candidatus Thermoplasmatota archaeon]
MWAKTGNAGTFATAPTVDLRSVLASWDLLAAAALAVLAAAAASALAPGDLLRVAIALPIALTVPGYLLVEALVGPSRRTSRSFHLLAGIGVSPGVVGLLALATSLAPGGFTVAGIVLSVAAACLALSAVALWRRLVTPAPADLAAEETVAATTDSVA